MADSTQHKLDRVRPPRVQITYDVETAGAIEKKELPFVVGIMADLSGMSEQALPPRYDPNKHEMAQLEPKDPPTNGDAKNFKYVTIDRDNFNEVMKSIAPRLVFNDITGRKVQYNDEDPDVKAGRKPRWELVDDGALPDVGLEFNSIEDFDPINVIRQVKPLRELLETRHRLADLLTKLEGNEKLNKELVANIFKASTEDLQKILDASKQSPAADAGAQTPAAPAAPATDDTKKGGKK